MPFLRGFGWPELVIILVIVMMVFGVGKLPQIGNSLGKGIREFRKGQSEKDEIVAEIQKSVEGNPEAEVQQEGKKE